MIAPPCAGTARADGALNSQKTLRDPILPMFSLCLSDVGVWDPPFLWISVFLFGIREISGIDVGTL